MAEDEKNKVPWWAHLVMLALLLFVSWGLVEFVQYMARRGPSPDALAWISCQDYLKKAANHGAEFSHKGPNIGDNLYEGDEERFLYIWEKQFLSIKTSEGKWRQIRLECGGTLEPLDVDLFIADGKEIEIYE